MTITQLFNKLNYSLAKPNSVTPFNKNKYLITSQFENLITKTYIFAAEQPLLLIALQLSKNLKHTKIIQVENLSLNIKLF